MNLEEREDLVKSWVKNSIPLNDMFYLITHDLDPRSGREKLYDNLAPSEVGESSIAMAHKWMQELFPTHYRFIDDAFKKENSSRVKSRRGS